MKIPPRPKSVRLFVQTLFPNTATVVFETEEGEHEFTVSTAMLRVYGREFIEHANKIEADAPRR